MVLEGESTRHCYPLQIRVRGGSGVIDEFRLDSPCSFSRTISLPAAAPDSGLSDMQVLSSAHFVPIKLGINKDSRRLSFRVQNLTLLAADGKSMVCQGR